MTGYKWDVAVLAAGCGTSAIARASAERVAAGYLVHHADLLGPVRQVLS